jgi:ATP-dependent helicase IRC3
MIENRKFYREYDLNKTRRNGSKKEPAKFQEKALRCLIGWYEGHHKTYAGKILVLPTGGGKTFVAIRFLCVKALSDGYKVLWLAHAHHLLEQAFFEFENHVNTISETQPSLNIRVVSGTKGHFRVHAIEPTDDVVVATLQTITKAYNERHPALEEFLKSADGKLFIVFDEAHHAPAPSYRKLVKDLRERFPKMYLLGLTATPFYSDEKLQGWLSNLFPQGFPDVVTPRELMAQRILAEPITEQYDTGITPDFDETEYQKWIGTFQNLPEDVITKLAENRDRNLKIAKHYADNRKKYGKTIILLIVGSNVKQLVSFLSTMGLAQELFTIISIQIQEAQMLVTSEKLMKILKF